ncbi:unnamed protein product, partial [Iphiclides podalirius]
MTQTTNVTKRQTKAQYTMAARKFILLIDERISRCCKPAHTNRPLQPRFSCTRAKREAEHPCSGYFGLAPEPSHPVTELDGRSTS